MIDITAAESDGFWAWAVTETLRNTGIRVEELLELTQLSLRHYTAASTGTLVPLLHIVPSKNDIERLIPMTPELVTVLVAVQRRAKDSSGRISLSIRYDPHEKVHGEPFPHLFVRRIGTRNEVLSPSVARRLILDVAVSAGLRDAGEPIHFTPHDFRRLFTTEMVSTGLPLHIAATLLGHLNLDTTRGYTAVFPEEVIAAPPAVHRTPAEPPARAGSSGLRPARSGPSSRATSCSARSPSATATAPTAPPASTNTPA